jgi:hypothetical protein
MIQASRSSRNDPQTFALVGRTQCCRPFSAECLAAALRAMLVSSPFVEQEPRMPWVRRRRHMCWPKSFVRQNRATPHIRAWCRERRGQALQAQTKQDQAWESSQQPASRHEAKRRLRDPRSSPRQGTKPSGGCGTFHAKLPQLKQRSNDAVRVVPMPYYRFEGCGRRRRTKNTRFKRAYQSIAEM